MFIARVFVLLGLLVPALALGGTLTVEEATELALVHSHGIRAAEAGEEKARAEAHEALLQFFPKLTASAGYTRLDQVPFVTFDLSQMSGGGGDPCADISEEELPEGWTVDMAASFCYMIMGWLVGDPNAAASVIPMGLKDNYFAKLTVEQVVFAGGALHQAHAATRDLHRAAEEQVRLAQQKAVYDAQAGFYQLVLAREAVKVTEEASETIDAYVRDLQAIVDVGAGSRADLLAAQAQQSQAQLDAMRSAHGAKVAEMAFKVMLGLPQEEPLELVMDEEAPSWDLPVGREGLLSEAYRRRPDLGALDSNIDALRHYGGATWASWLPAVVVMGNLNWKNPNYSLEPEWYRSADITVAASWNLWDRGAALHRHRAARASARQLSSHRELLAEMMGVEVQMAVSSFDEAAAELEVAEAGLAQAEEAYRLEHERFLYGMANNTQLLGAHTALSGARLSRLQAQTQLRISHAAVRKAVGWDPEVNR
ncbi:MAG: TolC family protein [Deltaproteobacteria bacterium]|nr:TolC family protein [Deltaproteobacteria bacterium]